MRTKSCQPFVLLIAFYILIFGCRKDKSNLNQPPPQEPPAVNDPRLHWLSEKMEGDIYWPSIAISGNTIYIGTSGWDGNPSTAEYTNAIYALDKLTGRIIWRYPLLDDELVKGAIVVDNNSNALYFIIIVMGGYDLNRGKTYLYSLTFNGSLRWKKEISPTQPHFWGTTSPALDKDGNLYINVCVSDTIPTEYAIISLDKDGEERWRYVFPGSAGVVWPTPTIYNDRVYAMTNVGLFALNKSTGSLIWRTFDGGMNISSPVIGSDGTIYVSRENTLHAYTPEGAEKWAFDAKAMILAQPVIGEDGTIYLGTTAKNKSDIAKIAGYFWAIDPLTGQAKWMFNIDQWMYDEHDKTWKNSDIYASPVVGRDGIIYFTTEYRYLWALNSGGAMKEIYDLSKFAAGWPGGTVTYSALVIDESGILYKADSNFDSSYGKNMGVIIAIKTQSMGLANSTWPKGFKDYSNSNNY